MIAPTLVLALAPTFAPQVPVPGDPLTQEEQQVVDKRPEIKELLKALSGHAKQRGEEDREAIEVIDELNGEFAQSGPKDRQSIVKGLDACLKQRRKETEEGLPDNRLHLAAAVALGRMGPESVKPLIGWIGHKQHKKDLALQRQLILSLGKTADEDAAKPLMDLLNDDKPQIQAASAEALADFEGAEQDLRKEIFEELLKTLMRTRAVLDQDQNEVIEHERWDIISAPIISSLQRLSGHQEHDAHEWQRWWNKNKREDWDEARG